MENDTIAIGFMLFAGNAIFIGLKTNKIVGLLVFTFGCLFMSIMNDLIKAIKSRNK